MPRDFFPRRESDVLSFSENFKNGIVAAPPDFGLTGEQAAQYAITQEVFAASYRLATEPGTRTSPAIIAKNTALKALEAETRMLARMIRARPFVTAEMRVALGLAVRGPRRKRLPPPAAAPHVFVESVHGRIVRVRLMDAQSNRSGRPRGTRGATLLGFVGDEPSPDPLHWSFMGNAWRTRARAVFGHDLPPGAKVWVAAFWQGTRLQPGPVSQPVSAHLQHSGRAAKALKLAGRGAVKLVA